MEQFSKKEYLQLKMPTEEVPVSDRQRIALALDRSRLEEAKSLAQNIYCVQLASNPDFLIRMQAAKFIPHTDLRRFPTVA